MLGTQIGSKVKFFFFCFLFLLFLSSLNVPALAPVSTKAEKAVTPQEATRVTTFCCTVDCMDGRVQEPVRQFMRQRYHATYVDVVTEAGPNKILAENVNQAIVANIRERLEVSVRYHGAQVVAIVGHAGCAGNPAPKEMQIAHLRAARKTVESFGLAVKVILLWVEDDWMTVCEIP